MQVTNLKVSKKLQEIGFGNDLSPEYYHDPEDGDIWNITEIQLRGNEGLIPAWDLETLISTLPKKLVDTEGWDVPLDFELEMYLYEKEQVITYKSRGNYVFDDDVEIRSNTSESLADLAGKMLILLFEKGLIKFE